MDQVKTEQFLPIPLSEAWTFFSCPKNLALITPPQLNFKILSELPVHEIYEGMKIDYRLKPLFGIPVHWQTEICRVKEKTMFTDIQVKGPYKLWEHSHFFFELNGGVLMLDEVNYQLPFGFIGRLVNRLLVKKKLAAIFEFRRKKLNTIFK